MLLFLNIKCKIFAYFCLFNKAVLMSSEVTLHSNSSRRDIFQAGVHSIAVQSHVLGAKDADLNESNLGDGGIPEHVPAGLAENRFIEILRGANKITSHLLLSDISALPEMPQLSGKSFEAVESILNKEIVLRGTQNAFTAVFTLAELFRFFKHDLPGDTRKVEEVQIIGSTVPYILGQGDYIENALQHLGLDVEAIDIGNRRCLHIYFQEVMVLPISIV